MSKIKQLNELLIQRADNELRERIKWLIEEAHDDQKVLADLEQDMFAKHCEAARARYISKWIEDANQVSDALKKLHGGAL